MIFIGVAADTAWGDISRSGDMPRQSYQAGTGERHPAAHARDGSLLS